jgi:hypothetical protein
MEIFRVLWVQEQDNQLLCHLLGVRKPEFVKQKKAAVENISEIRPKNKNVPVIT